MLKNGSEIKLIVSDIDGTILTSRNELLPEVEDLVRSLVASKDCALTFSSGRSFPLTLPIIEFFGIKCPFIYSGGTVYSPEGGKPPAFLSLDEPQLAELARVTDEFKTGLIIHTLQGMYARMEDLDWEVIRSLEWIAGKPFQDVVRVPDLAYPFDSPIIRLDFFAQGVDWLDDVREACLERVPGIHAITMSRSVEITPTGVHKGAAMTALARLMGIHTDHILAIGDSINDLPMIKMAGVGIAMGSAPEALKRAADIIVPPSDQGGYLQALELCGKNIHF